MKIAVVGSGVAGLAAAYRLRAHAETTLFEAGSYFGGHANTVDVTLPDGSGALRTAAVDTGFLVFNERTYPGFIELLDSLHVPSVATDMSFSVQVPQAGFRGSALEWNGANLSTVFAQPVNLLRPRFWRMLLEVIRFNKLCTAIAESNAEAALMQPLGDFLTENGFSAAFRDWYFLPMLGCIWSCPTNQMLRFPVATMIRFCHNHGLIQVNNRPQWRTVSGGARQYVSRIIEQLSDVRLHSPVRSIVREPGRVKVVTDVGAADFDAVVLAVHSDQALGLLAVPSPQEQQLLSAIQYQSNRAVLHTDVSVMPERRAAWAAWNYERSPSLTREAAHVCLHYWINRLQPLPFAQPVMVSLNPIRPIAPGATLASFDYAHPVFDLAALQAQSALPTIQGHQRTWFCGAWTGYGFHEDGLRSGYAAADALLAALNTGSGASA